MKIKYQAPNLKFQTKAKFQELKLEIGILKLLGSWVLGFGFCSSVRAAEELRDVRPPVAFPPNYFLFWLLLGIFVAGLFFMLARYLWPKLRKKLIKPVRVKTACEIAYERLDQLSQENLPSRGLANEFYSRLSLIVRHYLEDRFTLRAPEMTTEEFLASLRKAKQLSPWHKEALREFMNFSDMVKFARHPATLSEMDQGFALARRLVDETKIVETSPL